MTTVEEAGRVIAHLNGVAPPELKAQMTIRFAEVKAEVSRSEQMPTDNLYVKGLPVGCPEFLLRAVFSQYGNVVRLKVLDPRGSEATDCAALVQLADVSEAKAAVEALHGRVLAAPMPPMRVRFAGKDPQPGSNLYVAGLPMTVHEQQLRQTFGQCGHVVRLRLLVQPGRPETHALVQMSDIEEACRAIDLLNGSPPESLGPTLIVRYANNRSGQGRGEEGGDQGDDHDEVPDDQYQQGSCVDDPYQQGGGCGDGPYQQGGGCCDGGGCCGGCGGGFPQGGGCCGGQMVDPDQLGHFRGETQEAHHIQYFEDNIGFDAREGVLCGPEDYQQLQNLLPQQPPYPSMTMTVGAGCGGGSVGSSGGIVFSSEEGHFER